MSKCFHQPDAGFQLQQDHTTSLSWQNQGNHRKRGHCLGITKVMFCVEMHGTLSRYSLNHGCSFNSALAMAVYHSPVG